MNTYSIFVHTKDIEYIRQDKEFNQHLDKVLDDFYIRQPYCVDVSIGKTITTCSNSSIFFEIDKKEYIFNWCKEVVFAYCKKTETRIKSFSIDRCWCNRSYLGTKVKPHDHVSPYKPNEKYSKSPFNESFCKKKVVVLYYEALKDCSDLIFIRSDEILDCHTLYEENQKYFLPVETGMAVVHSADLLHAVSENKTNEQRTVFVFEITLEAA